MRRLVPLQHVQCLPTDLAGLNSCLAVFREVLARSSIVIQFEETFGESRAKELVGYDVVRKNVGGGVVRDLGG